MGNILASLTTVAGSFSAYEQALQVVSNNTTNSTTPGYANQNVDLVANTFDPATGVGGGVNTGPTQSTRDAYAEFNVQNAQSNFNYSSTLSTQLQAIQPLFDIATSTTGDSGVGGTLNQLLSSFSQLSLNPNNASYRQAVLTAAGNFANAANATSNGLSSAASSAVVQAQGAVSNINTLVSQIQQINVEKQRNAAANSDPGIDAQLYSDLESLSKIANISTIHQSDGTTSIYLSNGSPLLLGTSQLTLTAGTQSGTLQITDSTGKDVTSGITGGTLGALVNFQTSMIPGYQTQLNTFAKNVADTINTQLAAGVDQNGNAGAALFTYNNNSPANSLQVSSSITTSQIAAATTAGGPGGNDNAVTLSKLATTPITALNNASFSDYYGTLETSVGTAASQASNNATTQSQLLSQTQTLRSNTSGVSLDQEAALMTEYQQSYDATSKLMTIVSQMVQTAIGMIPQG